ncbi:hypothetical protein MNBD_NITROSPINAE04-1777 [hydrothermal vent metagenome]|uniref:Uncharacterized protein n=1 Tax=hydrothermal vent metagenome TaxID=652676 RepID=A0A3B1CFY4_9ZZZZ
MSGYHDLIELIAKRQMGILGKRNTMEIFGKAGLALDSEGKLDNDSAGYGELEALTITLHEKYGPVPIMGCKIPVARKAKELNLKLPPLFA